MHYIILTIAFWMTYIQPAIAEVTLPDSCLHDAHVLTCYWPHDTDLRDFHHKQIDDIAIEVQKSFETPSPLNEILLQGHSSTWQAGTPVKENAVARALSARKMLENRLLFHGVPLDQLNIIATGASDEEPLYTNDTGEGRAYNRRVEITLSHTPLPGDDDHDTDPVDDDTVAIVFSTDMAKEPTTKLRFPTDMPPVRFPNFKGCSDSQQKKVNKAWALAHYYTWRADQVMDWLADHPEHRSKAWSKGAPKKEGDALNYSPRNWFGPYSKKRFKNVDLAIETLFNKRFLNRTFKVICKGPGAKEDDFAHHNVFGRIAFYDSFLSAKRKLQALTIIHELYHPMALHNGTWTMDTHCVSDKCSKYYDEDALKLSWGKKKRDYRLAIRNNDNHAYFITTLGDKIRRGKLVQFPPKS